MKKIAHIGLLSLLVLQLPIESLANVMSGGQFQVVEDTLDLSGGIGSSENFRALDSAGGVAVGNGASENFTTEAGYTPTLDPVFIALSGVAPVVMDTPLGGLSGGESNGSLPVTVTTNNPNGYQLSLQAEGAPALQSGDDALENYNSNASSTDFDFTTTAADAHFGFSVFGADVTDDFVSNGTTCGSGTTTRGFCWRGLATSSTLVAQSLSGNAPAGVQTEILYRAGIGNQIAKLPGNYVATTTITALPR